MESQHDRDSSFRFRLVCDVFGTRELHADEIDIAPLDDVLRELSPVEQQIISLRLEAGLAFSKVGPVVGLKDHVARRMYQTALTKLRHRERLQRILAAVTPSWRVLQLFPHCQGGKLGLNV